MDLWQEEFEQLLFVKDTASGLKAVIVIHNTKLGPATGRLPDEKLCRP